ncbi:MULTISPECIES: CaiB/BaiF CoA transferase family protein [Ramlibacter]|uniref:CoA transferase n=1 Tax=Ramlibacter pinisoli TaxID=2682844 RepID=A0A6N8J0I0_9BURK|nr:MULTISPECIES: CoA transferase [Ramlibacter]MBA2962665.1 CoA transferase [Ramlibacter sp. CGMCC 1.13660]MVQ32607.1 CoA transferase [Ramlibacter pinisoli]
MQQSEKLAASAGPLPFAGLRVLDASQGLAGPYCGMLLAQHGADVIKLEPPEGDWSRAIGQRHGSHSAIDLMGNRGKRSLAIDLKKDGAAAAVLQIAAKCDVVIESFRPGVAAKLGIGYEQVQACNPGVVYLSVSGFGQQGANANLPATDTVIQGYSGLMSLNADGEGRPRRLGFLAVDTLSALYAFQAVSAALYGRLRGLPGQHLDVSLMQSTAAFLAMKLVETSLEGESPVALNVPAGAYRTQDGWIAITLSKEAHYAALCRATDRLDLAEDPAFDSFVKRAGHAPYLQGQFAAELLRRGTDEWLKRLAQAGVVASRINTLTSWLADPNVVSGQAAPRVAEPATGGFHFPRIPGTTAPEAGDSRSHWPDIGSASHQILQEFGFSAAAAAALLKPAAATA